MRRGPICPPPLLLQLNRIWAVDSRSKGLAMKKVRSSAGGSRGRISGRGLASCRGKAAFQRSKLRSRRYLYSAMPRPTLSAALCVVLAAACCTSVMAAALDDGPVDTGTRPAQQQLAAAPAALASAADFVAAAWSRLPHCPAQAPWLLQMQRVEDSCSRRLCRRHGGRRRRPRQRAIALPPAARRRRHS